MNLLTDLVSGLKGYKTYLAAFAAILSAIAPLMGFLNPTSGAAVSLAMLAAAQIFQRMATRDHQLTMSELVQDVEDLAKIVNPASPIGTDAQQTTNP